MKIEISDEEAVRLTLLEAGNYSLLVQRYQSRLVNFVRSRFIYDTEDASDIVQDSLVRGYMGLSRFDFKRKWKPWIYKITANTACDFIRNSKNYQEYLNGLAAKEYDLVLPEVRLDEEFTKNLLGKALEIIEPKYAEILRMCYIENKNLHEIGIVLGLTLFLVKIRFERAKTALRKAYVLLDSIDLKA